VPPTVAVIPAGADEVSAGIARVFSQHAQGYQALAAQAAAFHDQFAQNLATSAFSYTSVENALINDLQNAVDDAGASLLGVVGQQGRAEGLLPQIAEDIGPDILAAENSTGLFPLFLKLDIPLLLLLLLYEIESPMGLPPIMGLSGRVG
jgi:PE family